MMSVGYHDFVNYCNNPTELIIKLYEQKSIDVLMGKENIDLHSMTSEIAERHGLNIEKIRQTLIQVRLSLSLCFIFNFFYFVLFYFIK